MKKPSQHNRVYVSSTCYRGYKISTHICDLVLEEQEAPVCGDAEEVRVERQLQGEHGHSITGETQGTVSRLRKYNTSGV